MRKFIVGLFVFMLSMTVLGHYGTEVQASSEIVKLMLDGEYTEPEVPARITKSRTFVPIRFISENMGADILWVSETSSIVINKGPTKIEMKLGSKQVKVNGQSSEMDVAPFVDSGRTLVPLRFVSEYLGLTVGWEAKERLVIVSKPITLALNGQAMNKPYEPIKIRENVYFPIFEIAKQLNIEVIDKSKQNMFTFSYYDFKHQGEIIQRDLPATEIITLDGTKMVSYEWVEHILGEQVSWTADGVHINRVNELRLFTYQDGQFSIELNSLSTKNIQHFFLQSPHRLVIDIPHTVLSDELKLAGGGKELVIPIADGVVDQVRVAQTTLSPPTVRIVFDLNTRSKVTFAHLAHLAQLKLEERKPLVVIDPGHGGKDPGAVGKSSNEAKIVLDISLKIKKLLEEDPNFDVLMTRDTNIFIELDQRVAIANNANADLFLSVHANAIPNRPKVGGTETFIFYNSDKTFGSIVHKHLIQATGLTNRGLKEAGFRVLRGTTMPAALIEIAFISNPNEEKLLNNPQFQDKVAQAMYNAIKEYEFGK